MAAYITDAMSAINAALVVFSREDVSVIDSDLLALAFVAKRLLKMDLLKASWEGDLTHLRSPCNSVPSPGMQFPGNAVSSVLHPGGCLELLPKHV